MTKIKDIYCIDINWIDKEINSLENVKINKEADFAAKILLKKLLLNIKSQLKPITPLIEDAWYNGSERSDNGYGNANDKEDYINIKQFEL